jgi:hypothetical protein
VAPKKLVKCQWLLAFGPTDPRKKTKNRFRFSIPVDSISDNSGTRGQGARPHNSKQWRHAGVLYILKSQWTFVHLAYGRPARTPACNPLCPIVKTTAMTKFTLPDKITITLVNPRQEHFPIDNILLYIKTKAIHKNDFHLGPFASDKNGIITITKNDLDNEVAATYDSGLMDYSSIENSSALVELRLYDQKEINKMIESRTKTWTSLLNGEKERWPSIKHLVDALKKSNNHLLLLNDLTNSLRAEFDGRLNAYEFQLDIFKK